MAPEMMMTNWALCAISAVAALGFGLFYLDKTPSLMRTVVKTLFMAPLVVLVALRLGPGAAPITLLVAVLASAAGDALLASDKPAILPLGILAFLIAQLCYLAIFYGHVAQGGVEAPLLPRYAAIGLIIVTTGGFLIWLWPKLGKLAFGVVPYSAAITAMACTAMLLPWWAWPAILGAALFVVSDGTLSAELFQLPPNAPARRITAPVVWWTYVAAQALILWGVLKVPVVM